MSTVARRKSDEVLITKLALGATQQQAAEAAGCCEKTVTRRLQDPAFRAKVNAARTHLFEAAFGRAVGAAQAAAGTLITLLSRDTPPATRLGAARTLLETSIRYREQHDLEERIKVLEDRLATQKNVW